MEEKILTNLKQYLLGMKCLVDGKLGIQTQLARELTEAFVNTCGGNKEAIKILITEVDKNDWASGGIITADKES